MRLKKPATYEDIVSLPENMVGEIVQGELFVSPRPAIRHALASSVLGGALGGPFHRGQGGPGGWWILDEVELHFGQDVLVPDLSGWRRARLASLPGPAEGYISMPPDWVCEVISPSTAQLDRGRKLQVYSRERVNHVWLLDPLARTLEVFRLEGNGWHLVRTYAENEHVRAEPFEAIELNIGELWPSSPDQPP
jgi:Uma2 family endonuclease